MGIRFAGENEMTVLRQEQLAERLMAIQIVTQQGQGAGRKAVGVPPEPPFGSPQLTILLFATGLD